MDFDQLTTFLEVAKLGSFSRAGQKVFRSQSAVSTQVRQLEQACGAKLLDRSGKDVTLTPAGRVLFTYAERILRLRDESLLAVADDGKTPRGSLSIGANEGTCLYVLPDVFAKYSSLHPGVQINIYRNFTYKIVEKLEAGSLDVGIITLPVKSSSLKAYPIFRDQLMWMVSPQSPLAKQDVVSIEQVAKQPLILPKTGYTRRLMDKLLRPYAAQLQVRMELPSVGMIKSFRGRRIGRYLDQRQLCARPGGGRTSQAARLRRSRLVAGTCHRLSKRPHSQPRRHQFHQLRAATGSSVEISDLQWQPMTLPVRLLVILLWLGLSARVSAAWDVPPDDASRTNSASPGSSGKREVGRSAPGVRSGPPRLAGASGLSPTRPCAQ